MTEIRLAKPEEFEKVLKFYYTTIDMMEGWEHSSLWKKNVYPSDSYIKESIEKNELWVFEDFEQGDFISSMILSHEFNEGYKGIDWPTEAGKDEILVVHAFGVLPSCHSRGIGSKMIQNAIAVGRQRGMKAIRLDVLEHNMPANKLYAKNNFNFVSTARMFYEDTGWTDFKLYEYAL